MASEKAAALQDELDSCEDGRKIKRLNRELEETIRQGTTLDAQIAQMRAMEVELWVDLWATPQAAMWEKLAWNREVAQYVRWKVRGELGDLDAAKEARQWSDRLGLNPLAMLRLRLEIERTDEAVDRGSARRTRQASAQPKQTTDPRLVLVQ